jgi:HEAT repeat protein
MVEDSERRGATLGSALNEVILDPAAGWYARGTLAKLLRTVDESVVADLLDLFQRQTEKDALWETALALETLGDRAAIGPLAEALHDANVDRHHAAARALGWIPNPGGKAAKALMEAISDHMQPQPVREEAAESLAYLLYAPSVPILISVLDEPDVRMRFWAVFALGKIGQRQTFTSRNRAVEHRIVEALEGRLSDQEIPPGNWWSVGKEALAMLGELTPKHRAELDRETRRVLNEAESSKEDLRWAKGYSRGSNE